MNMCVNTGNRFGLIDSSMVQNASMTAGLVQEYDHAVLPSIRPFNTLTFTITASVVSNVRHWFAPTCILIVFVIERMFSLVT